MYCRDTRGLPRAACATGVYETNTKEIKETQAAGECVVEVIVLVVVTVAVVQAYVCIMFVSPKCHDIRAIRL